ncbi:MAG: hypothetical protein FJ146_07135 [Deltaproteobacteria bacterium]|nr:hypothetical protein [Deltaproteobacteria bacterium]
MTFIPKFIRPILAVAVSVFSTQGYAQLPPIMNPPNAQWYLWTCYGKSAANNQDVICGQAYGYNDYWARYACGATFSDVRCWPTSL